MNPRQTPSSKPKRCSVEVNLGDPALPVIGAPGLTQVRKSRTSRLRAASLITVHVLIAGHAVYFALKGHALSPIEPSESMYTLELGYLNCGFLFFAAALLLTVVFGRFFCGWGCHIVAVQDLCGAIMKRLGIRPRPLRSRVMAFVPLLLAFYMFAWPFCKRVLFGIGPPFPGFTNHLTTTGFWQTFPGPVFTILTLASCGFAAVYFLGAKGFCTYGCPYGALFYAADTISPGKIVVNDSCEQCGHCTATCTSNVRVHEEVRLFGMVVDPGCMKCMDCVSVCPKGALSFGFARPALFKPQSSIARAPLFLLPFTEEFALTGICLGASLAFRGLYDGPPLLMSVGLGGVTAFIALKMWHLLRKPSARVQNLTLKAGGRLQAWGWLFACLGTIWLAFTAHSGFVQWHRARGRFYLDRTEATRADVFSGQIAQRSYSPRHEQAVDQAVRHFQLADRFGLADVVEVKLGLAWTSLLKGDPQGAEVQARRAAELAPEQADLQRNLYEILMMEQKMPEAIEALRRTMQLSSPTAEEHFHLGGLLAEAGRFEEAEAEFRACLALKPDSAEAHYNLGGLLRRSGRSKEAVDHLRESSRLAPDDVDTLVELGLAESEAGQTLEAIASLKRAIELDPNRPEARVHLPELIQAWERSSAPANRGVSSRLRPGSDADGSHGPGGHP